jgi:hypothetical protein
MADLGQRPFKSRERLLFVELHDVLRGEPGGQVVRFEVVAEADAQRPHR